MQRRGMDDPYFQPIIRISIVTARGAPSEERLITTLKSWGMNAAELFLLDGMPKNRVLEQLRPHIFFDDQMAHLEDTIDAIPSVLVPFGINSERSMQNFVSLANTKRNQQNYV
jgi:5'-nucleotidase